MYNAEKVADVVEEVNRRRDMIHQDAGNLNNVSLHLQGQDVKTLAGS